MQSFNTNVALPSPVTAPPGIAQDFNIPYVLGVLRRGWLSPVIGCLIGMTAALTYIAITPSLYKSSARILIDRSVNRYLHANKIIDEPVLEDSETGSQIYVLSSESIIGPVVRSMNLAHDPEFVGAHAAGGTDETWNFTSLITPIKRIAGFSVDASASSDAVRERIAVETFVKRLTVYREDVPSVISVTFASENANKAADIANAIADGYLAANQEAKSRSTKMATQLLQERLAELKQQAADAERRLQEFKIANNLGGSVKTADSADQISSLYTQLSLSRAAMAEAKARLDLVQQPRDGVAITRVADNEVILRLRTKYLEYATRAAEIESRVGQNHAAVAKMRKRMEDVHAAIQEEQQRIASNYKSDYQLAKARSDELAATLSQLTVGTGGADSQAKVTMRELESAAETLRNSYNTILQRRRC